MSKLKAVYVLFDTDIKDTVFYNLRQYSNVLEEGLLGDMPNELLEAAKDPIIAMTKLYVELSELFDCGMWEYIWDGLLSREDLFKMAGREIMTMLSDINRAVHSAGWDIEEFNYAKSTPKGILLFAIHSLDEADYI